MKFNNLRGGLLFLALVFSLSVLAQVTSDPPADEDMGYMANPDSILGQGIDLQPRDEKQTVKRRQGGPTGSGIQYIREEIPEVVVPPYQGAYYEMLVPDTLDLAERARLSVHGLSSCTDPEADYEIYGWGGAYAAGVPTMRHDYHDFNGGQAKWIEALMLQRSASGSTFNAHVDRGMMQQLFHMIGEDGLYWIPVEGSPWTSYWPWVEEGSKQVYDIWPMGRALRTIVLAHLRAPENDAYRYFAEKMIDGLTEISIDKGDYWYLRRHFFDGEYPEEERLWIVKDGKLALGPVEVPTDITVTTTHSTLLTGIVRYYESTGYPPAKELADKLAAFLLGPANIMKEDGTWVTLTHFHGMLATLMGLYDYGQVMDKPEIQRQVNRAYEHARTMCDVTTGWVPEYAEYTHPNTEPCGIGDMVSLGAKLSHGGFGDWWEDVETITRNLLAEAQITQSDWYQEAALASAGSPPAQPPESTGERVAQRMIGTFRGMVAPNCGMGSSFSHCCSGNSNRGMYFAWRYALEEDAGKLRVNLLLNRASKWADVNSHLPYQGRVDIVMKSEKQLEVRIPSWVEGLEDIECTVNGIDRSCSMNGRYLQVGTVSSGDRIRVLFPIQTVKMKKDLGGVEYDIELKGFDIIGISPKDSRDPFFERDKYRQDTTRYKMLVRFAPEEELNW